MEIGAKQFILQTNVGQHIFMEDKYACCIKINFSNSRLTEVRGKGKPQKHIHEVHSPPP